MNQMSNIQIVQRWLETISKYTSVSWWYWVVAVFIGFCMLLFFVEFWLLIGDIGHQMFKEKAFTSQTINKKMIRNLSAIGFSLLILMLFVLGSDTLLDKCVPIKENYPQAIASQTKQVNHVYDKMLIMTTNSGKNKYLYLTDDASKMQSVKKQLLTNNKSVAFNITKDDVLVSLNYGFSGRLKSYRIVKSPTRLTGDDSNNIKAVKIQDSKALESNIMLKGD